MSVGLVGRKAGMTRVFTEDGRSVPVTVVEVTPNRVTQVKGADKDGYQAIQVTTGTTKASRLSKPAGGHFAKAKVEPGRGLWEFRVDNEEVFEVGEELNVSRFTEGQKVDVTGTSKGKGYAGTIKRWNFSHQDNSHGNSISHRAPGSIGQCQTPGKVFKGKKMAGHLGAEQVTVQTLEIVRADVENNILLVSGAVPGAKGSNVIVRPAIKLPPPPIPDKAAAAEAAAEEAEPEAPEAAETEDA